MKKHDLLFALLPLGGAVTLIAAAASPATAAVMPIYQWGRSFPTGATVATPAVTQDTDSVQADAGNYGDVLVTSTGTVSAFSYSSTALTTVSGVSNVTQRPVDGDGTFSALEQPGTDKACPASSTVVSWIDTTNKATALTFFNCLDVVQLAKAANHTFALTASGNVYVWGGGSYGVLGLGAGVTNAPKPTLVPAVSALTNGSSNGVEITTGMNFAEILVNGQVYSWGNNQYGQCGCGSSATEVDPPTAVDQGSTTYSAIDDGGNLNTDGHALAIDTNGDVWAWGDNAEGQLGVGTVANSNVPVAVTGLPAGIVDVRAGGQHSLALDGAGNVWAWGSNTNGQVGNGSASNLTSPTEVLSGVSMISAGSYQSLAE